MSEWNDVYKQALNVEEAALLPASGRSRAGKSALQDTMRRAEAMAGMQVSNPVEGAIEADGQTGTVVKPVYAFPGSRAALHQVRPHW